MSNSVAQYITEDGVVVSEGDSVYDYYTMEPVVIGPPAGSPGWFTTLRPGSVTPDTPRGVRSAGGMLNGSRTCTLSYARRRGFPGV